MNCPECGKENQDDVKNCQFCNTLINVTPDSDRPVTIRVSRLAITAFIFAVLGSVLFLLFILSENRLRFSNTREIFETIALFGLLIAGFAVILGVISIVRIGISGGKITGSSFAVAAALIPILSYLLFPLLISRRCVAFRMVCGTKLSGIGKAMLIYANDYDDELPRAGGTQSVWANQIPNWKGRHPLDAYGINLNNREGGQATISSSLYLLVKYAEVEPKSFLCENDLKVNEFDPAKYGERDEDLIDLWDFGPEPWKHCSYSYHMPYGKYSLTVSSNPGLAVAADRNPWIPSLGWKVKDISKFNPDGDRDTKKAGNAFPHKNEGQNVLFLDSHVDFENIPFCGVNEDNIYTYQNGEDIRRGSPPQIGSQPTNRADSMLVNDPPIE